MKCKKCHIDRLDSEFTVDKSRLSGVHPYCVYCMRAYGHAYASTHRDEARAKASEWYSKNRDRAMAYYADPKVKAHKAEYMRRYRKENRDRKRELGRVYEAQRQATDMNYRLSVTLRKRLGTALRGMQKSGSAVRDLGCSIPELKEHLEQLFLPGMSWSNWSRVGWHIDHIRPLSSFDLSDPEQFKQAVHYTNLQPLWAADNLAKGARVPESPLGTAVCHQPSGLGRQP